METISPAPSLRLLLDHFAAIPDRRQPCKVMYPLREVLLLVVCGTLAGGDDYDDIVDWGEAHLGLLRRFCAFHFGIPCADWLRVVMNRIDPDLFADCFTAWVAAVAPGKADLVAIDGKTSRRSHDRAKITQQTDIYEAEIYVKERERKQFESQMFRFLNNGNLDPPSSELEY